MKRHLVIDPLGIATNLPDGFNVLALYFLENFNRDQLKQFVKFIASINRNYKLRRYSIWIDYINKACFGDERSSHKALGKFMECVTKELGESAAKKLMLAYDDVNDDVITSAAMSGYIEMVEAMLIHSSDEVRYEIRDYVFTRKGVVEKLIRMKGSDFWTKHFLEIDDQGLANSSSKVQDGFNLLSLYFLEKFDKYQLEDFIKLITSEAPENEKYWSIWGYYADNIDGKYPPMIYSVQGIEKILKCVSNLLGEEATRELFTFDDGAEADEEDGGIVLGSILERFELRGSKDIAKKIRNYLNLVT